MALDEYKDPMTFVEAFKAALGGLKIRRRWWNENACLQVDQQEFILRRKPEFRNWTGPFSPTIDDVEATDWQACDDQ